MKTIIIKMKIFQFAKKINFLIISPLFLGILGVVIYFNSFSNSFHFDDRFFILGNEAIRKITDLEAIWYYCPTRFFGLFSFAINYQVGQFAIFGYHLFNLVLHILTAILVFIFTALSFSTPVMCGKEISKHKGILAFFAAAIFLSHPVQTQAVNYIFQRVTILATFFYLTSLCLYVQAMFLIETKRRIAIFCYGLSLVVALMGMFTKEIFFTLPIMILFYDFCFLRTNNRWRLKYSIPFLAMLPIIPLTILFLTPVVSTEMHRFLVSSFLDLVLNFLTQCRVVMTYLRLLVLPFNQNLDYDYSLVKVLWFVPALISFCFLGAVFVIAIRIFSKFRLLAFSIFWFFIALAVESSIIPMTDVINEHRLYLPMVGFSFFLVSLIYYLFKDKALRSMVVVLLIITSCYAILTYRRNLIWKDEFTLWNDVVHKSPKKVRPHNNRGNAYYQQGNFTQAISDYSKAIAINPNFADAYNNRGLTYYQQGNFTQAISDYSKAIENNPNFSEAYNNRGNAYYQQGNFTQAISDYNKAKTINPNDVEAYYNRGNAYVEQGNIQQAISDYSKAIEINPKHAEAYNNRGNAYYQQGNFTQVISDYSKAIEINPNYADAYNNRGLTYYQQGNFTQAISDYSKAIEINPNHAEAYSNRGGVYFMAKEYDKAWEDVHKAKELGYKVNLEFRSRN